MNKRLTEVQRIKLEARFQALKDVSEMHKKAEFSPDKAKGIWDNVPADKVDLTSAVEALMRAMDAKPEVAKIHDDLPPLQAAKKAKLINILKKAMDLAQTEEKEGPEEEAHDLHDPAMHMVEDLEHEVQTLDDATLEQLVQKLEERMKMDLAKTPSQDDNTDDSVKPASEPVLEPKPAMSDMFKDMPDKDEDTKDDDMKPEHRLALLMSLPKEQRLAKASQLKALAGVLEKDEREVSQDNKMVGKPNDELAHDYENEEEGSMKDVKSAALKSTARQLLAALDEDDKDESPKKDSEDSMDKEAVLKLALKHLIASVEDMEEAKDNNDSKEDEEEAKDSKEASEPTMEEKKAILRARLNSYKNTKTANVDGKSMKTPKEVPTPSGTTEDNLKGDAKVQYFSNNPDNYGQILSKRDKVTKDKEVTTTNGEPNELYFSNNPSKDRYEPTSDSDSSKDVNNKRVLRDGESATYNSTPTSPTDHIEHNNAGTHQKAVDWETAKDRADMTPKGDRLVGLAEMNEIIKTRTDRAVKLAGKMAELNLIKTEAQLGEKIAELAGMDDTAFTVVASFLSNSLTAEIPSKSKSRKSKTAGEMPPWLDKNENGKPDVDDEKEEDDDYDDAEDDEDESHKKEAGVIRRASDNNISSKRASKIASRTNNGLKQPLMSGTDSILNQKAISRGSDVMEKIAQIQWTDPEVQAREKADINQLILGN